MKILEILLNFRIPTSYSFIFIKFKQHFTALFHNTQEEYIISQLHSGELKMSLSRFSCQNNCMIGLFK
jgi:hypothetical protein